MPTSAKGSSANVSSVPRDDQVLVLDPFDEIVGVPDSDPVGLIPRPFLERPLECRVPRWLPGPTMFRSNTVQLIWKISGFEAVADFKEFDQTEFNATPFPYSLYVPTLFMISDSVVEVFYRIKEAGSPDQDSPSRILTVDRTPPTFISPDDHLEFVDPAIAAGGITEAVLAANEFIEIRIPPYNDRAAEDSVAFYMSPLNPPVPQIPVYTQVLVSISDPLILRVHRDFFRALPNGPIFMTYRLFDRTGNFSGLSAPTQFRVSLVGLPSNLPPPQIRPPAYNDPLLNRDDARAGIAVQIPSQYTDFMPGDEVLVIWAGRQVLPAVPVTRFPFDVDIPWSILRIPGPLAREEVPVHYEIRRPLLPPVPSPTAFFWTDFTIAGQDHANAPLLLNDTLARLQVFGNGSGLTNELDIRDRAAGANVWVRLFADPQPGQVLELYWNGTGPIARYVVQLGDSINRLVRFVPDVSGAIIVAQGNHPTLPVFYTTSNGVNEQVAPNTPVNVHVDPVAQMPAPRIGHTLHGAAQFMTCESRPAICHGVLWVISPDPLMRVNDELVFEWQGFRTTSLEDPIGGTEFEDRLFLTTDHLRDGVVITVSPWDTRIAPMVRYCSASGRYYLLRGGAVVGESLTGLVRIDRVTPGGTVCFPGDTGFCDGSDE